MGSMAAMDMLIALPEMDSQSKGGWLFDFKFNEALQYHEIKSRRWTFRSAHNINNPDTPMEKRAKVEKLVRTYK